jgi:hypothetical protein
MKKLAILLGILLFLLPLSVQAAQPSQSYSKIPIFPLYRESMAANTNYTYTMSINPPDGISSVVTATIFFNAQINGQSQNFTLWVNGQSCNTRFYYIATAFSAAGNTQFYFDCSNVITKQGNYTITIRSAVATGVISGWLDMTYMNSPQGDLKLSGTEYNVGDYATIFLQLKDNQGFPINDGQCYLDVYYPSYANQSHPILYDDIAMQYKNGSNGLYYFDMVIPNVTGVYMLGASCAYSYDVNWLYPVFENVMKPNRTVTQGTYVGDTLFLNSLEDWIYTECDSASKICNAYYDFNTTGTSNITSLDIYYSGETQTNGVVLNMSVWNWTSSAWITLPNTLTFHGTGTSGVPSGVDEFLTNTVVPSNYTINYTTNIVRVRLYSISGSTFTQWDNWLSLKFLTREGSIQELKGSGELHVSNALQNLIVSLNASQNITALSTFADGKYVGGTEYISGDRGRTLAQVTKISAGNQEPVLTATCSVNITYPNGTAFVTNGNAPLLTASNGLYYYNFTIPSTEGIYAVDYKCLEGSKEYYVSGSFHVSNYISGNLTSILSGQASIFGNLTSMTNYLITINSTTFQINQSLFNDYNSLLSAINSVNATANQSLSILFGMNQTLISLNQSQTAYFQQVLALLNQINSSLNTTIVNYLSYINGTTFQMNQSQTTYYLSLLNAINSVNASVNAINLSSILNYLMVINDTTYQINSSSFLYYTNILQAINNSNTSQYQQYLDLLNLLYQINQTGNTTLEFVASINQSLLTYYTNLYSFLTNMNASIMSELTLINTTINQYSAILNEINATTHSTESKLDLYYSNLIAFLQEINYTLNTTLEYKLDLINNTLVQINGNVSTIDQNLLLALEYLRDINYTTNTTIPSYLISINNTQNQHFATIMEFLASINYSINTTMEYKLDLINQTTFEIKDTTNQINYTVNNLNFSVDLSAVLSTLNQINTTVNQNQQYLIDMNGTLYQINQTQAQYFLQIMQALSDLNLTMNTTLLNYLVTINGTTNQINNTLMVINGNILDLNSSLFQYYQDLYVILTDINYTTNTTLELKMDFINSTTWQTWLLLQNLTIGNVSVSANVNWTQGYLETSVLSFSDKINGEGIDLFTETLTCLSNTTLQHLFNGTKCLQGSCFGYNETTSEICQWGCGNNACLPAPPFQYMAAIGFALMVIGGMYVAWRATK